MTVIELKGWGQLCETGGAEHVPIIFSKKTVRPILECNLSLGNEKDGRGFVQLG